MDVFTLSSSNGSRNALAPSNSFWRSSTLFSSNLTTSSLTETSASTEVCPRTPSRKGVRVSEVPAVNEAAVEEASTAASARSFNCWSWRVRVSVCSTPSFAKASASCSRSEKCQIFMCKGNRLADLNQLTDIFAKKMSDYGMNKTFIHNNTKKHNFHTNITTINLTKTLQHNNKSHQNTYNTTINRTKAPTTTQQ